MSSKIDLPQQIMSAISSVLCLDNVPLHEPVFQGQEWNYLKDCLESTYVSSTGPYVDKFEADLAHYTGAGYAVAVSNGTAALHIALVLADVKPGDEVLVPSISFVATANAVSYCHAKPHFMDSCSENLGVDPVKLDAYLSYSSIQKNNLCINKKTGNAIKAMVPMHVFGHPVGMDALKAVADHHNIKIVEDAAESLGSYYNSKHAGTLGDIGVLSFNGNKIITTGGGGAVLTNNETLAKKAKHLSTTAKVPHKWEYRHDEVGYNYRMPNINAALGCAQLEQLEGFLKSKRALFAAYEDQFENIPHLKLLKEPEGCQSNYWLQAIVLDDGYQNQFEEVLKITNENGLMTRPLWLPLHQLKPYQDCSKMDLSRAENFAKRVINIPSSSNLMGAL